jgi:hypothetical protein
MSLKGLILEGLSWTTTDADILKILDDKTPTLVEIHFDQLPYNGKSCGSVYLCFTTSAAAREAKKPLEKKYNVSLATRNPYIKSLDEVIEAPVPQMMDPSAMFGGMDPSAMSNMYSGDQWAAYQAAMQPVGDGGREYSPEPKRHKKKRSSRGERRERSRSRSRSVKREERSKSLKREERDRSVKRDTSVKPERRISDVWLVILIFRCMIFHNQGRINKPWISTQFIKNQRSSMRLVIKTLILIRVVQDDITQSGEVVVMIIVVVRVKREEGRDGVEVGRGLGAGVGIGVEVERGRGIGLMILDGVVEGIESRYILTILRSVSLKLCAVFLCSISRIEIA